MTIKDIARESGYAMGTVSIISAYLQCSNGKITLPFSNKTV